MAINHGKVEFSKIKESISNIPMQAANVCNVLQRPEVSNWSTVVKLIRDLKYRGYVYFESVLPHIMYEALAYLKRYDKLYEGISTAKGVSREDMFRFSWTFTDLQ